jgi:hypothetical protein
VAVRAAAVPAPAARALSRNSTNRRTPWRGMAAVLSATTMRDALQLLTARVAAAASRQPRVHADDAAPRQPRGAER